MTQGSSGTLRKHIPKYENQCTVHFVSRYIGTFFAQVVEEVKKVPKSKTWFLGGRMAKAKAKGGGGKGSRRRSTLTQAALEAKAKAATSEVTKEQQGCNSIDTSEFGRITGCQTGPHSGSN